MLRMGSRRAMPVRRITIAPIRTANQARQSSNMWRLTVFWLRESPWRVIKVARRLKMMPRIENKIMPS